MQNNHTHRDSRVFGYYKNYKLNHIAIPHYHFAGAVERKQISWLESS